MQSIAELTQKRYNIEEAKKSRASLSQGEIDVLEQARVALGWPSILSLAFKYYPAFPNRKWWLEALRRGHKWARRMNITYLLKALQSISEEALNLAFSGKAALNRLVHLNNHGSNKYANRLEPEAPDNNSEPDLYIIRKYGHLVRGGGAPA